MEVRLVPRAEALAQGVAERALEIVIAALDINALLDRVDLDRVLDQVDVERVLDRIDVDRLVERIDLNRQLAPAGRPHAGPSAELPVPGPGVPGHPAGAPAPRVA
jgi:hypothetical protein